MSDSTQEVLGSHASSDLESRNLKARKIHDLLGFSELTGPLKLLEVGAGSGGVSQYFATLQSPSTRVDSVDVKDERTGPCAYKFQLVSGVDLPFPSECFDVVISNHVIEHVGDRTAQFRHLSEIFRVLSSSGVAYLAVPNRWQWIEPHYKLAGLSWLPEKWRSPYLRWRRCVSYYDCRPLSVSQIESLLDEAGFQFEQQHGKALHLTFELERPNAAIYRFLFRYMPDGIWKLMRRAFPTLIYICKPKRH